MNDSKNVDKTYSVRSSANIVTFSAMHKKLFSEFSKKRSHTSKFCRMKISKCNKFGKSEHYKHDCRV